MLFLFRKRGFALGRIIEAGETVDLPDDTIPGAHMLPVGGEPEASPEPVPVEPELHPDVTVDGEGNPVIVADHPTG